MSSAHNTPDNPAALAAESIANDPESVLAALDIGSNSFHMVIARRVHNDFQLLGRYKEQVQLAAGLNQEKQLSDEAIQRGLRCLDEFSQHLKGIPAQNVQAVATHTLRIATNADDFIERAHAHFPAPIQVISGVQEGRYIYQGVAHISDIQGPLLVIDIGGGSTEFVIGAQFNEHVIRSRPLGCVNMTQRFFPDGQLNHQRFTDLVNFVSTDLQSFSDEYLKRGWQLCMGASGSIKAVSNILKANGYQNRSITLEHLLNLREQMLAFSTIDAINLPGLPEQRGPILPAALGILIAAFDTLQIDRMEYSRGALREGLLYNKLRD